MLCYNTSGSLQNRYSECDVTGLGEGSATRVCGARQVRADNVFVAGLIHKAAFTT